MTSNGDSKDPGKVRIEEARASGKNYYHVPIRGHIFTVFADYLPGDRSVGLGDDYEIAFIFDIVTNITSYLNEDWRADIVTYLLEHFPDGRSLYGTEVRA